MDTSFHSAVIIVVHIHFHAELSEGFKVQCKTYIICQKFFILGPTLHVLVGTLRSYLRSPTRDPQPRDHLSKLSLFLLPQILQAGGVIVH